MPIWPKPEVAILAIKIPGPVRGIRLGPVDTDKHVEAIGRAVASMVKELDPEGSPLDSQKWHNCKKPLKK